ncbi:peptidase inhibitor family I36 protein [Streptomyces sp. NPDC051079]|uniref:peptidase inhibitor family I36 protein n=1 Tax=Streptomyces sp. NPDC051079 TaxID=3155043 RepID=UPI00344D3C79
MQRNRLALAVATGALAAVATLGTGAGTASAGTTAVWQGCQSGQICVYPELNGYGTPCVWYGDDRDWRSGFPYCDKTVKSIWNRGTGGAGTYRHVKFYFNAGYDKYYACAAQGFKGNTGPTAGVVLRSHIWATSC